MNRLLLGMLKEHDGDVRSMRYKSNPVDKFSTNMYRSFEQTAALPLHRMRLGSQHIRLALAYIADLSVLDHLRCDVAASRATLFPR